MRSAADHSNLNSCLNGLDGALSISLSALYVCMSVVTEISVRFLLEKCGLSGEIYMIIIFNHASKREISSKLCFYIIPFILLVGKNFPEVW